MKITIETNDRSARWIGILSFVLGGILILLSFIVSVETEVIFAPLMIIILASILLFTGLFLVSNSMRKSS